MTVEDTTLRTRGLLLRPWRESDAEALIEAHRDPLLRQWIRSLATDGESAAHWLERERRGWETGTRCGFAVFADDGVPSGSSVRATVTPPSGSSVRVAGATPSGLPEGAATTASEDGGLLAGHVVVSRTRPGSRSALVGYWTTAPARGRGVATRALDALSEWCLATFAPDGLEELELFHRIDNEASCRVAEKSGYGCAETLPAGPAHPAPGHRHVRPGRNPL
ncbi:GNAT family N-acetyltransferase [Streptomyces sp. NPDC050504]|uniref:GNAT family N-acetyltransferase n=1 Tax=Streptomyces sp. NPDC050504 TaxID=3365618 RepID=UPI0037AE87F3